MDAVRRSSGFGYFLACASTAAVAVFRWAIGDYAADQVTLLPFLLSVTIAARFGGLGPGLLATVLGAFASVTLFLQPLRSSFFGGVTDQIRLCVFLIIGAVISYLYSALLAARARAETNALEAIEKQQRLEDADRNKNEFLATLAHEMRNPLAAIQNQIAVAQLGELPSSVRPSFESLQRQAFALTRLTADLSDLSAIGRGKMRLTMKSIDLRDSVRAAIDTIRPGLTSHSHTLDIDLPEQPLFVMGDALRLTQVFVNLLTNSIKYTNDGGDIRIAAFVQAPQIVVHVIDNGIGVSREHLPRLFKLGEQVESDVERSEGGLGIGLAVVRRLVEMHGGSVHVASEGPGHGCRFSVQLPTAKPNPRDDRELDSESSASERACNCHVPLSNELYAPRILVVDDHGSIARTSAAILRDCGCETRSATDGRSAIQMFHDFRPDIVLIDINMPEMNGYELARRIKELGQGKKITLVAMTGASGETITERCAQAGYAYCLQKPLSIDDLRRLATNGMECADCRQAAAR